MATNYATMYKQSAYTAQPLSAFLKPLVRSRRCSPSQNNPPAALRAPGTAASKRFNSCSETRQRRKQQYTYTSFFVLTKPCFPSTRICPFCLPDEARFGNRFSWGIGADSVGSRDRQRHRSVADGTSFPVDMPPAFSILFDSQGRSDCNENHEAPPVEQDGAPRISPAAAPSNPCGPVRQPCAVLPPRRTSHRCALSR